MLALTVKNPWAYCILYCGKDVENRAWYTSYRGVLFIHASKKDNMSDAAADVIADTKFDYGLMQKTNGCIIGTVTIVDCIRNSKSKWADKDMRHWILANPVLLSNPFPARGRLGLWELK